jgi:predicted phosphodiesterase
MRIALLSDIHGHFGALERAWRQALKVSDRIACLGDLVDGGGQDDECAAFVREAGIPCVAGNHDRMRAATNEPPLRRENLRFLGALPRSLMLGELLLVHDNPLAIEEAGLFWLWRYVETPEAAREVFAEAEFFRAKSAIAAIGHSHLPGAFSPEGAAAFEHGKPLALDPRLPWLLNPGSVGAPIFPRLPTFGVFDAERREFALYLVPGE